MKPTQLAIPSGTQPIGYARLITTRNLSVIPPFRLSFVARGATQVIREEGQERVVYTPQYDPGDSEAAHLEFAIKHEGVNLEVLEAYFTARGAEVEAELTALIQSTPTGVFARRLWCLYEWLTGRKLPLPDMTTGNYQPLLDPSEYVTIEGTERFKQIGRAHV